MLLLRLSARISGVRFRYRRGWGSCPFHLGLLWTRLFHRLSLIGAVNAGYSKPFVTSYPKARQRYSVRFWVGVSIEINLAYRGYTVHAYDNYAPLVNFWQHWLDDPESVRLAAYELLSLYDSDELSRFRYKKHLLDKKQSAAFYYLQNKCAWNGKYNRKLIPVYLRSDGEYLIRPHEPQSYNIFNNFDFWQSNPLSTLNINHGDFEQVFWIHQHQFAYIDPPYFGIEGEYGGSREKRI